MNIGLPLGLTLTDRGKVAIESSWGNKAKKMEDMGNRQSAAHERSGDNSSPVRGLRDDRPREVLDKTERQVP
jgi:hypothetical protein